MKIFVWALVVLLIVLRNDFWNWENTSLIYGFMPVTLAYHCGISIAATVVWYLATVFAWPVLDESDAEDAKVEGSH